MITLNDSSEDNSHLCLKRCGDRNVPTNRAHRGNKRVHEYHKLVVIMGEEVSGHSSCQVHSLCSSPVPFALQLSLEHSEGRTCSEVCCCCVVSASSRIIDSYLFFYSLIASFDKIYGIF